MVKVDLTTFSASELNALMDDAKVELSRRQEAVKKDALARIKAIADEAGLSAAEVAKGTKKTRAASKVKYRNPNNPDEAWTGRGKRPKWLETALAEGASLEHFLAA